MVVEHPIQVKRWGKQNNNNNKTTKQTHGEGADQGHDQDPALGRAAMNAL